MTKPATMPETLSLHVPFRIAKRGGRKEVQIPPGAPVQRSRVDNTLVKALARAFRCSACWKMAPTPPSSISPGPRRSTRPMSSRVLRLTLLAPDIVEATLDGKQEPAVTLARVLEPFPLNWAEQRDYNTDEYSGFPFDTSVGGPKTPARAI